MLDLSKIQWPIYPLDPKLQIVTIEQDKFIEMPDESYRLLDSSDYIGNLAQRRIQYEDSNLLFKRKLFKLKNAIFRFEALVHEAEGHSRFIDSNGRIFNYKKSIYYPLIYHKITKFVETRHGYAVEVKGFHCRFFLPREPQLDWHYAGILHIGRGSLLYDFAAHKKKDSRRMI
jgi:hypothetical protein